VTDRDFGVLFVCTGNICRSPAAELLFRARLDSLPVRVSSAGTSGLSGHDVDAPTAYALRERGIDPSPHAARRLTADMIAAADLILTAETAHRSVVVQAEPLAFRRAFTIREFARLGAGLPELAEDPSPRALRMRVAEVADQRGQVEPGAPGSDEIGDPIGAGLDVARVTVARIDAALDGVARALGMPDLIATGRTARD
jgi:protein-tyrosine phosphatase